MTYTLKAWTKPGTTETRIYINGGRVQLGDKLFIYANRDRRNGEITGAWDAKLCAESGIGYINKGLGSSQYDIGLAIAEEALKERGIDRASFAEIVATLA